MELVEQGLGQRALSVKGNPDRALPGGNSKLQETSRNLV